MLWGGVQPRDNRLSLRFALGPRERFPENVPVTAGLSGRGSSLPRFTAGQASSATRRLGKASSATRRLGKPAVPPECLGWTKGLVPL